MANTTNVKSITLSSYVNYFGPNTLLIEVGKDDIVGITFEDGVFVVERLSAPTVLVPQGNVIGALCWPKKIVEDIKQKAAQVRAGKNKQ